MLSRRPDLKLMFRAALIVATLCIVAFGVYILDDRLVGGVLMSIFFAAPLGAIVGTAIAGRRGAKGGALAGVIGGAFTGPIVVSYNLPLPGEDNLLVLGLFTNLLMAPVLYWTFKRTPDTPVEQTGVRTAARYSLVAMALAVLLSLLRTYLRQLGHSESSEPVWMVDVMKTVVMGLVILPWIVLARRRAAGPAGRPYSRWDRVAKALLLVAAIFTPVSHGLVALLVLIPMSHGPYAMLGQHMLAWLIFAVGLGTAGVCFALGFAIQCWRDRWYLTLTAINVLWLVALWAWVLVCMCLL